MAFTAASDAILTSVPPERAGAAAAVSETGYELGMALGIATLGSIINGVYHGRAAGDSLSETIEVAACGSNGPDAGGSERRLQQWVGRGHRCAR